mgnify:CR=1 FL=1
MKVVDLSPVLFREYDLRGVVGDIIDEDVAYTLGLNYGSYVLDLGINKVVIGRDNRVSSPSLARSYFIAAQPPLEIPMPDIGQNELLVVEIPLTIDEFLGMSEKVEPNDSNPEIEEG